LLKRKKTSLNLDVELLKRMKKLAVDREVTLTQLLEQLMRECLSK
jgi:predicted DNA-binding ribbon-helix-helix protein